MLVGLFVLGFVYNAPITLAYIVKLVLGYWPQWQTNLYWYFLIGGILFGAGWAVMGYCPGTSVVAMASRKLDGLFDWGLSTGFDPDREDPFFFQKNPDNLIVGDDPNHVIATVGIEDLVVIHTQGATLICHRDHAQKIKQLHEAVGQRFGEDHL